MLAIGRQGAWRRCRFAIKGRRLVRVLAVTQVLHLGKAEVELCRIVAARGHGGGVVVQGQRRQIVADGRVVLGHAVERGDRQHESLVAGQAAVAAQRFDQRRVLIGRRKHRHIRPVFCGRAQHRRAADVDVLDGVFERAVGLGNGGFEWIEIEHQQIDGGNAVLCHHGVIGAATAQQAAVNFRVQGFHPAVHDLWEPGMGRHLGDRQAGLLQRLEGAAGGKQRHIECAERLGERNNAGLVGNGKQCAADRCPCRRRRHQALGSRLCCWSFLRRVARLSPSHSAALDWFPPVCLSVMLSRGTSISRRMVSYSSQGGVPLSVLK